MHVLRVGHLYDPERASWPEGTQYAFRGGAHELLLFFRGPTAAEVEAVRRGRARFALYAQGDLLVLCSKFGDQPWADAPFSWHLLPEGEREGPPELTGDERIALQIILVDAATGIVHVLRLKRTVDLVEKALAVDSGEDGS